MHLQGPWPGHIVSAPLQAAQLAITRVTAFDLTNASRTYMCKHCMDSLSMHISNNLGSQNTRGVGKFCDF